jgi:PIN domain nuclease of toxin-antitoxin system
MLSEIFNQAGQYIVANPVEFISYTVTGATVTSFILREFLPNRKWDNKVYRFLLSLTEVIALDSKARKILGFIKKHDGIENEKDAQNK